MASNEDYLEEIRNIDYFLAHLEMEVEQGEIGPRVFDRLAVRYTERRDELVAAIAVLEEREAALAAASVTEDPKIEATASPAAIVSEAEEPVEVVISTSASKQSAGGTPARSSVTSGQGGEVDRLFDRGVPPGAAPWASKRSSFSLGRWIAYAGASLAVITGMIFAFRGLSRFPLIVVLAGLIGATVILYADGDWLRRKLSLPVLGFWLMAAGGTLFVLDGYVVLQILGLSGPFPWAVVLLVCSIAYWLTEGRVGNGWFGVAGEFFQFGFWWMLAYALGLGTVVASALIGVVAAIWAVGSTLINPRGPYGGLARVLATGSLVVTAVVTVVLVVLVPAAMFTGGTVWPIGVTAVSALAALVTFDRVLTSYRGWGVSGQVPLLMAVAIFWSAASTPPDFAPGLGLIVLLLVVTLVNAVYALWRGSTTFAVAAYIGWLMMWTGVAYELGLGYPLMVAATAALGIISLLGALGVTKIGDMLTPPLRGTIGKLWQIAGALTVLTATVATVVLGGFPGFFEGLLFDTPLTYLKLTALVMAAIVTVWLLLPRWWTAALVILGSFVLTERAVWFLAQSSPVPVYAVGLVLLAVAWSQVRDRLELVRIIPYGVVVIFTRVLYCIVPLSVLAVTLQAGKLPSYAFAVLLAVVAVAWFIDALTSRSRLVAIPVPTFAIAAIAVAVWTGTSLEAGAIAGSITALGIGGLTLLGQRGRNSWAIVLLASSAATATLLAPLLIMSPGFFAIELILGAAVWALLAWAFSIPEAYGGSAGLGVLAVAASLAWLNPPFWVTLVVLSFAGAALLVPRMTSRTSDSSAVTRTTASLAAAGLLAFATLIAVGLVSYLGLEIASARWASLNASGLGVALLATGGYVLAWTLIERAEIGLYIGFLLIVLGVLMGLDAAQVQHAEAYLLPVALYFGAMGMIWASRKEGREVPLGTDLAVVMLGPVAALIISLGSLDSASTLQHGYWALGLSVLTIFAGVLLRARVYVIGGAAVLVANALSLSRGALLGFPNWALLGGVLPVLILGGILYAFRRSLRRLLQGSRFADWR
jgi:hypothetical protein